MIFVADAFTPLPVSRKQMGCPPKWVSCNMAEISQSGDGFQLSRGFMKCTNLVCVVMTPSSAVYTICHIHIPNGFLKLVSQALFVVTELHEDLLCRIYSHIGFSIREPSFTAGHIWWPRATPKKIDTLWKKMIRKDGKNIRTAANCKDFKVQMIFFTVAVELKCQDIYDIK